MRKNNTAIIFGSLFFSCSVMAANGTLAPTVVPMVNGGQASIAISNTSPNLFTVPGDRIIAVNSLDGALTNNEQTASGGVVVATVNKKPFTFILETERGLNLSIQAVPREGAGRTIQLVSDLRGTGEEAGAWETSTPYESLLVTISQAVRGGKLPAGWYQVPVTKETLKAPAGLSSVAEMALERTQNRAEEDNPESPVPVPPSAESHLNGFNTDQMLKQLGNLNPQQFMSGSQGGGNDGK
ncbi:type-F conjugative transfer system secretin TraK [Escherichia coli]|uniref:type-F conjugative transfer system secretin TraK n=1 Tax=Escherichia coli TaxID=562 RepID=UPI002971277B|nr:type-F conjugative transfer system secretin TraK [Escherichia coli]